MMIVAAVIAAIVIVLVLVFALRDDDDDKAATKKQDPAAESTASDSDDESTEPDPAEESTEADPAEESTTAEAGIEVDVADRTATYSGPTTLAAGATTEVTVLVRDEAGKPVAGVPWFLTIGDPPSSPDAVHVESVTDDDGVARFQLTAPDQAGANELHTSDGDTAVRVAPFQVT